MNDLQVNDVIESLKSIIADQAYKIAYRDAVIASHERQIRELSEALAQQTDGFKGMEVGSNDDVR